MVGDLSASMDAHVERMKGVINLVVDSAGFLKNVPLKDMAENIFTDEGVINEIRDKATKERLQVLPYKVNFKRPTADDIKFVTDFAKKTGDYCSLSAVDLRVIALTYHLEKELAGEDSIRKEPFKKDLSYGNNKQLPLGFYIEKEKSSSKQSNESDKDEGFSQEVDELSEQFQENMTVENDIESELDHHDVNNVDDGSDDEEGWVTVNNIKNAKESEYESKPIDQDAPVTVACLTTDYAIQNVLIQMGLNVVSIDGMLIKQVKMYILRCFACFKTTTDMTKKFCPHCGNMTLRKTSYSINDDGTVTYYMSRRPPNKRGLKYSLPTPRGGKFSNDPILCEDQRIPQQRAARSAQTLDPLYVNYVAGDSPFSMRDVNSRSAKLGFNVKKPNGGRGKNLNKRK